MPVVYICDYSKYQTKQPRIHKIAEFLQSIGYETKWIINQKTQEANDISVGPTTKTIYIFRAARYLRNHLLQNDIVLGYVHVGGLAAYLGCKKNTFIYDYPDPWFGWTYVNTEKDTVYWKLGRALFRMIEKKLYRRADGVLVASITQKEFLESQHGKRKNIEVVFNCASRDMIEKTQNARQQRTEKKHISLLFLGNVSPTYGPEDLLQAFSLLSDNEKYELVFLSSIKENEYIRQLKKKYGKTQDNKKIVFHEPVPHQRVKKFLAQADIGFVPYRRTFYNSLGGPNKLFEYMSSGVAPVVTDMEEIKHHVTNGVNGIIVPAENPERMKEAIQWLAKNPSMRDRIAKNNMKKALLEYNWEMQCKKVQRVLKSALAKANDL